MLDKTTILLVTHNRSKGLIRSLEYLAEEAEGTQVVVADSSAEEHAAVNAEACNRFSAHLKINRLTFPGDMLPTMKWYLASKSISTEFMILWADDDFHIPATLRKSQDFLTENPDYAACQGYFVKVLRYPDGYYLYDDQINLGRDEETAPERMWNQIQDYAHLTYSLRRTEVWRDCWAQVNRSTEALLQVPISNVCLQELEDALFCLMHGKLKRLPLVQTIRNDAPYNGFPEAWGPTFFFGPDFAPVVKALISATAISLNQRSSYAIKDCEEFATNVAVQFIFRGQEGKAPNNAASPIWKNIGPFGFETAKRKLEVALQVLPEPTHDVPTIIQKIDKYFFDRDQAPVGSRPPATRWSYLLNGPVPVPQKIARVNGLLPDYLPGSYGIRQDGWCRKVTQLRLGIAKAGQVLTFHWLATASGHSIWLMILAAESSTRISIPASASTNSIPIAKDYAPLEVTLSFESAHPLSADDLFICSALLDSVEIHEAPTDQTRPRRWF